MYDNFDLMTFGAVVGFCLGAIVGALATWFLL